MSQKKDKKLRKQYRKDVEDFLKDGGLYELYELIVKPKPRFVPKWLWMFGVKIFMNVREDSKDARDKAADK